MKDNRVVPLILEQLDESLIVLMHSFGWTLADIVVVKPRKALSQHPTYEKWPQLAIQEMNRSLHAAHEYEFYDAARQLLNEQISTLSSQGINIQDEILQLKALRERVGKVIHLASC